MADKYDIIDEFGISVYDMPDTECTPVHGTYYELETVAKLTQENLVYIIEKHNKLVEFVARTLGEE